MKGDIVRLNEHHIRAAKAITAQISNRIIEKPGRYIITVAGESGSGKSETALAIANELKIRRISSVILGQDDYFYLPPRSNSEKRRADPNWLGPHVEVNFKVFEQNLVAAVRGSSEICKPLIDYNANIVGSETINLADVKVIIAEGTYTSLLKHVDLRIFITRNWLTTLEDRKKRNRGNEVNDAFTENILVTEHKIIAGHRQLADFIIDDNFEVMNTEVEI